MLRIILTRSSTSVLKIHLPVADAFCAARKVVLIVAVP